jgi:hypothetical protein
MLDRSVIVLLPEHIDVPCRGMVDVDPHNLQFKLAPNPSFSGAECSNTSGRAKRNLAVFDNDRI